MANPTMGVYAPTKRARQIELRASVWDASGGRCHYCGVVLHPIRDFTVDHVLPVIGGGSDEPSNLVAACVSCNLGKGDRLPNAARPPRVRAPKRPTAATAPADALTVAEVAERLKVYPGTVKRWLRDGRLVGVSLGDRAGWRIAEADLERFLLSQSNVRRVPEDDPGGAQEAKTAA